MIACCHCIFLPFQAVVLTNCAWVVLLKVSPFMAHRIPETSRPRSARDYFLQSLFRIVRLVSSPTLFRLWLAFFILLPTYIFTKAISVLPTVLGNILLLFDTAGRSELRRQADSYRRKEEHQARQQLNGTFRFQQAQLVSPRKHAIRQEANWYPNIEDFEVCGARVNVVVERSVEGQDTGQTVVLLHGSLGWSFMWRGVSTLYRPHLHPTPKTTLHNRVIMKD